MASSGKSQLVRTLAKKFPCESKTGEENSSYMKWHIRCRDTGDDLQKKFQHLVENLHENYFTHLDDVWQNTEKEFRKNQADKFVKKLLHCKISILIILKDPAQKDQNLLQDFFVILTRTLKKIIILRFTFI